MTALLPPGVKVHLALGYIDMRKGLDELAMLVQGVLRQDPFTGHLFVFRGRTRTGRLWVYARDDRPWNGPDQPAALYLYSPDRKAERPASHLAKFKGVVHVDRYPGFDRLSDGGHIQLAACWAHVRRKFYEVHEATGSPIAAEALRRIAELYVVEAAIRGQAADARRAARRRSLPLIAAMKTWFEAELHRIPPRGPLAEAIKEQRADRLQEGQVRRAAIEVVIERLEYLAKELRLTNSIAEPLRVRHRERLKHVHYSEEEGQDVVKLSDCDDEIELLLITAEREYINTLSRDGRIEDEVRRRIERELDLREAYIANHRGEE